MYTSITDLIDLVTCAIRHKLAYILFIYDLINYNINT